MSSSEQMGRTRDAELRALPAVSAVLGWPRVAALSERYGQKAVARAAREVVAEARRLVLDGVSAGVSEDQVCARMQRIARGTLAPVINGTGIIVHTNLGRSPLAPEALDAVCAVAEGYATLEYDLDAGERGDRHAHARDLLVELTGAEDALVVNNNAGAVLLTLAALAARREVIVSRGELVEIGGGFRIPDVLAQSGARLVEVGTTNRTHLRDYEQALGSETALLLKVHRSNFAIVGYTKDVPLRELAELAHARGLLLVYDAGSGCIAPSFAKEEATVASAIADGADVVVFSGDKLLGGPQAGIAVGRRAPIEAMRRHPLVRALRSDKLCLAALVATLTLWRDEPARIPVVRMASLSPDALEERARRLAARCSNARVSAVATIARMGGGAAPLAELPSWGVRITDVDARRLAQSLRGGAPPIIARIEDAGVVIDLRCVPENADEGVGRALADALSDE